ncbi:BON domain-containing protein [Winogradskyella sp. PC D3.3]
MRTDLEIKDDILEELKWQPHIDETQIGVIVKDGVVTLTGMVFTYAIKIAIVKTVEKIAGVKAIAEDIKIGYPTDHQRSDSKIATVTLDALEWNASVPNNKVIVEVDNGWITLLGELEWAYQRDAAKRTVEYLEGVKGVTNNIKLKQPLIKTQDIQQKIKKAFERSAFIDAKNIAVAIDDHKVILSGKVHSLAEKNQAESVTFNAPGVYVVKNELEVEY